tara:strand:- start:5588 stop:6730 length:1143 start_codon:yes stop_codon:yes gene_type:complete
MRNKILSLMILIFTGLLFGCGGGGGGGGSAGDGAPGNIPPINEDDVTNPDEDQIPEENPALNYFDGNVEYLAGPVLCELQPVTASAMTNDIAEQMNRYSLGGTEKDLICANSYNATVIEIATAVENGDLKELEYNGQKRLAYPIAMTYNYDATNQVTGAVFYVTDHERAGAVIKDGILAVTVRNSASGTDSILELQPVTRFAQNHGKVNPSDDDFVQLQVSGYLVQAETALATSNGSFYDWSGLVTFNIDFGNPNVTSWWMSDIEADMEHRPVVQEPENEILDQILKTYCTVVDGSKVPLNYTTTTDVDQSFSFNDVYSIYVDDFTFYSRTLAKNYSVTEATLSGTINGTGGLGNVNLVGKLVDAGVANAESVDFEVQCR